MFVHEGAWGHCEKCMPLCWWYIDHYQWDNGILETKMFLSSTLKMKDLGQVDNILGIKAKQNSGGFELGQ